jgi:hypothetical protein
MTDTTASIAVAGTAVIDLTAIAALVTTPSTASVAAALAATPSFVAAVAAAIGTPVVSPPPPPPPSGSDLPAPANLPAGPYSVAGTPDVVFAGGVLNWPVDFSYGGLQHSIVPSPTGSGRMVLMLSTPQGTGGWQPAYQNPPPGSPGWVNPPVLGVTYKTYDTTGKAFLNLDVLVTLANCTFVGQFMAANDGPIPGQIGGIVWEKFGGPLVVGKFVRLKLPLGPACFNIEGASVLKWNFQENNPIPGNKFYVDNAFFSAT